MDNSLYNEEDVNRMTQDILSFLRYINELEEEALEKEVMKHES